MTNINAFKDTLINNLEDAGFYVKEFPTTQTDKAELISAILKNIYYIENNPVDNNYIKSLAKKFINKHAPAIAADDRNFEYLEDSYEYGTLGDKGLKKPVISMSDGSVEIQYDIKGIIEQIILEPVKLMLDQLKQLEEENTSGSSKASTKPSNPKAFTNKHLESSLHLLYKTFDEKDFKRGERFYNLIHKNYDAIRPQLEKRGYRIQKIRGGIIVFTKEKTILVTVDGVVRLSFKGEYSFDDYYIRESKGTTLRDLKAYGLCALQYAFSYADDDILENMLFELMVVAFDLRKPLP